MIFREANIEDISQIQFVRNSVKENILSNPDAVKDRDVEVHLTQKGKGWVCEIDEKIVGFSIVDLANRNIWALFIHPNFEKRGIGKKLHILMLDWYFSKTKATVWLGTSPGTRAAVFYKKQGWKRNGIHGEDEIKFEMTYPDWLNSKREPSV